MAYVWTNEWATGNQMIDTQHKQLFTAINSLLDACSSGHGRESLDKTINFLVDYTAKHFGDEEKLQQQYHYPDYPNHHMLHEGFKRTVADLGRQLRADGPTVALVAKVNTGVGGWLVTHIQREDKKVAAHIKKAS